MFFYCLDFYLATVKILPFGDVRFQVLLHITHSETTNEELRDARIKLLVATRLYEFPAHRFIRPATVNRTSVTIILFH